MTAGHNTGIARQARFIQPATVVPQPRNPQALNRYSYALNNALKYTDPTGHGPECYSFASLGPGLGSAAVIACQLWQAVASYGPQLVQLAADLSQFAASPQGQLALQHAQQVDAAVKQAQQPGDQGGNTADPGGNRRGPDPRDPWFGRELTLQETRQLTDQSTVLGEERITVIGRLAPRSGAPGYQAVAQRMNASYLRMDEALYNRLAPEQFNQVNGQFLRDAVVRGDRIYLGTELGERVGQLAWELDFLAREFGLVLGADGFLVPK